MDQSISSSLNASQPAPAGSADSALVRLQSVFNFTPEDLAANRQGQATPRQLEQVKRQVGQSRVIMLVLVGVVLAIVVGAFLLAPNFASVREQLTNGGQNSTIIIIGLGGTMLLYLVMMGFALVRSGASASGRVTAIRGPYRQYGSPVRAFDGQVYQRAAFGRRQLLLKIAQADVFTPKEAYTVYVAGSGMGGQILSVEPPTGSAAAVLNGSQAPASQRVSPMRRILGAVMLVLAVIIAVGVFVGWDTLGHYVIHFTFLGWNAGFLGAQLFGVLAVIVLAVRGAQMVLARGQ